MPISKITTWWMSIGANGRGANNANGPVAPHPAIIWLGMVLRFGCRIFTAGIELLLSARGMASLFFLVTVALAYSCWLRPPMSPDIRGYHLSLGLWSTTDA